jgi:hypothetical protein
MLQHQIKPRVRRPWQWYAVALACVLAGWWTIALAAVESVESASLLSGTWTNSAQDRGRAAIEHGVDQAIADMFVLARPTARSRLLEANPPIARLEVRIEAGKISVDLGHGRNTKAAPNTWQPSKSVTGDPVRIRYSLLGERGLKMESVGDQGTGRHTFQLSADNSQLKHEVRIESPHLPNDVRYSLTYRRMP